MSKTKINYRRADNGQYTTEQYAKRHPKTTVKESDRSEKGKKPSPGRNPK
jgi:hypothetical protein